MGTLLGPKYIPYTYMDPLGYTPTASAQAGRTQQLILNVVILKHRYLTGEGFRDLGV